jgi:hypothetical protein
LFVRRTNKSALSSLRLAARHRANQLLLRFLERNKRHGCQIVQVNWIASEANPADPISRGMAPDTGLIETFVVSGTQNSKTSATPDDAGKQKSN